MYRESSIRGIKQSWKGGSSGFLRKEFMESDSLMVSGRAFQRMRNGVPERSLTIPLGGHDPSCSIPCCLETFQLCLRQTSEQAVAVVESRQNHGDGYGISTLGRGKGRLACGGKHRPTQNMIRIGYRHISFYTYIENASQLIQAWRWLTLTSSCTMSGLPLKDIPVFFRLLLAVYN